MLESYLHYAIDDSYQGSIINWPYNQTKYNEDEIIESMTKSWFNNKQNASQNQERIGCAVSSWLTHENVCCPNFQNTSLAGNFGPQIWLPNGHFGQLRAIGPMELLRPAVRLSSNIQSPTDIIVCVMYIYLIWTACRLALHPPDLAR